MELKITIVTVILFTGLLISFGISLYSHLKGYLKGQIYFTLMMLFAGIYSFGGMIESAAMDIPTKILWSKIEYIGVSFAPVFLLQFVFSLVNSEKSKLHKRTSLLYIVSVAILILSWTNEEHHLVWKGFQWGTDSENILTYIHGIAWYLFALFSLLLIITSIIVLASELKKLPVIIKKQIRILIIGCLAPLILTTCYIAGITPLKGLDLTIISLPIMGLIILIGIFRFGMFKIIPTVSSQITNIIQDGLIVMDENSEIVFLNPSASKILGFTAKDSSFLTIKNVGWLKDITLSGAKGLKETEVMTQSDPELWLEISINEIRNEDHELKGNLVLMHDISKRKRLEFQTRNLLDELNFSHEQMKEANSQKDRIMSIIAHDLRTTFHQVINLSGLMKEMAPNLSQEDLQEYLADLLNASEQGYSILEELLTWAKTQNNNKLSYEKIEVNKSVEQIISSMTLSLQNKDLHINLTGNKEMTIFNDHNVLNLVVRNILINAIKFSLTGSTITIDLGNTDTYDFISISDTGIGIPEADLPKLFNSKARYSRTGTGGESGSGLGLLLCKEMIERNCGSIEVESKEGIGSTFTIKFNKL
jgi:signal transduction histidine kinase